jgi:hypothetical protein
MVVACGSGRGVFGWRDGDAGVGEVEDVGRPLEVAGCRRRRGAHDAGAMQLAESAVNGVLGEEREPSGDLSDTRLHDEPVIALLSVVDEVVENDNGLGPVLLDERQRLWIPVFDADLGRRWRGRCVGVRTGSDVLRTFAP